MPEHQTEAGYATVCNLAGMPGFLKWFLCGHLYVCVCVCVFVNLCMFVYVCVHLQGY